MTFRPSEPQLFGYVVSSNTQVVLVAQPPTRSGMYVVAAISVALVAYNGISVIFPALLLCGIFFFLHSLPSLVLVAVEKDAIVTIRSSDFGRLSTIRIPWSEVLRVERGNMYFPADFTIVQRGNFFHDIDLITKGKGAHPRFHRLINQTELPFPEDPQTHPYEIADMLCFLLTKRDVTIRSEEASLVEHLVYSLFRPRGR
jgi:hypothetical protein